MKKRTAIFLLLLAAVMCPGSSWASEYVVRRGDNLDKIARTNGTTYQILANTNGIKNPNRIAVGQKITIPDSLGAAQSNEYNRDYENPGADSFDGTVDEAAKLLGFSADQTKRLKDKVSKKEFTLGQLKRGDYVRAMVFGKKSGSKKYRVKKDFRCAFRKVEQIDIEVYDLGDLTVIRPACNNWSILDVRPPKKHPEEVFVPEPPSTVSREKPCPDCDDVVEIIGGAGYSVHAMGKKEETTGFNTFGELVYWRNFDPLNCDSEYWWGIGGLASYYNYEAPGLESKGKGYQIAGQLGIKQIWENEYGYARGWQFKPRLGWEWSRWENTAQPKGCYYPREKPFIEQDGPVIGFHAEYRHQFTEKLEGFVTADFWTDFMTQKVKTNLRGIKPSSRTFFEGLVGFDYRFRSDWTWRVYGGFDYQGWDNLVPAVIGTEIQHDLADDNGMIAVGAQLKIYSAIDPTSIVYARYEGEKKVKKDYREKCADGVQLVGQGIGGEQFKKAPELKPVPVQLVTSTSNGISSRGDISGDATNTMTGASPINDGPLNYSLSGGICPPGNA